MDGDVARGLFLTYFFYHIAGLMDDIALKVYDAFAYHVTQANFNHRVKTVSLWSLQMTAGAVLAALRSVVDPISVQVRDLYQDGVSVLDVGAADAIVPSQSAKSDLYIMKGTIRVCVRRTKEDVTPGRDKTIA